MDTKSDHVCLVCSIEGKHIIYMIFPVKLSFIENIIELVKRVQFYFIAPECGKNTLHYGGICCYSCRAFFRRAHQHTKTPNFICRSGYKYFLPLPVSQNEGTQNGLEMRQCGTDVQTKRQCQYHRLKRCLEIGTIFIYHRDRFEWGPLNFV